LRKKQSPLITLCKKIGENNKKNSNFRVKLVGSTRKIDLKKNSNRFNSILHKINQFENSQIERWETEKIDESTMFPDLRMEN